MIFQKINLYIWKVILSKITCHKMATVSRLKKGTRQIETKANQQAQKQQQQQDSTPVLRSQTSYSSNMSHSQRRTKAYNANTHTKQAEKEYQGYYEISQSNPLGVTASVSVFPHTAEMNDNFNVPLGFIFSPMLVMENQHAQVMQKSADKIPRCGTCRAYMNCYNTMQKNKFTCFLCNRDSFVDKSYDPKQAPNQQWNSSIYQALGPSNFYNKQPAEDAFIFMIDISPEASKMLYYAVAAMKEVLARPDLDDLLIYFYTYDDLVHSYDFSGEEVKCTIVDQTIDVMNLAQGFDSNYLKDIRKNLFILLDNLEDIAKNNHRKGYNFTKCFNYIFHSMKHLGGKFFIFQVNEAFGGQPAFMQNTGNSKVGEQNANNTKTKSYFESNNKNFFDRYTEQMLKNDCSFSVFGFASHYKNYKTINDTLKLTSSQLKVYAKQCAIDMQKFYYELSYLLGATYFKNVFLQLIISAGWQLAGVYGNYHRIRQTITFQINSVQGSRKTVVIVNPSPSIQKVSPFCGLQAITNYRYKRQSFMSVATIVQPISGYMEKLYEGIDSSAATTSLAKKFLSILRMEPVESVRRKMVEANTRIYQSALSFYKKHQNIPDSVLSILMGSLAMLKSPHSHPELIDRTPLMDKITSERNALQFSGPSEVTTKFCPYLFDLTNLDQSMCGDGADFSYPPTLQIKFQNVRDGLFLLDNGLSLTLFIAKHCDPNLLQQVFGKAKLTKQDILNQQLLSQQNSPKVAQIQNLVKFLREQKMYGWIPLYIVRCGENSLNERNFYLNFYAEKYEEYRVYKFSFEEYLAMLSTGKSF